MSNIKWTFEALKKEAKKYKKRIDFQRGSASAYQTAIRKGCLDKICGHMVNGYVKWDEKSLKKEANGYQSRADFQRGSNGAYHAALRNGYLDQICQHMNSLNNNEKGEQGEKFFLKKLKLYHKNHKSDFSILEANNKKENGNFYPNYYECDLFGFSKMSALRGDFHLVSPKGKVKAIDVKNYGKTDLTGRKTSDINLRKMIVSGLFFKLLKVPAKEKKILMDFCENLNIKKNDYFEAVLKIKKEDFFNFVVVQELGIYFYNKMEFPEKFFVYLDLAKKEYNLSSLDFSNVKGIYVDLKISLNKPDKGFEGKEKIKIEFYQGEEKFYVGRTRSLSKGLRAGNAFCYPKILKDEKFSDISKCIEAIVESSYGKDKK